MHAGVERVKELVRAVAKGKPLEPRIMIETSFHTYMKTVVGAWDYALESAKALDSVKKGESVGSEALKTFIGAFSSAGHLEHLTYHEAHPDTVSELDGKRGNDLETESFAELVRLANKLHANGVTPADLSREEAHAIASALKEKAEEEYRGHGEHLLGIACGVAQAGREPIEEKDLEDLSKFMRSVGLLAKKAK